MHDYIGLKRATTNSANGAHWLPSDPLHIKDPTYDGARLAGTRRRWFSLTPDERLRLVSPGGGSAGHGHNPPDALNT